MSLLSLKIKEALHVKTLGLINQINRLSTLTLVYDIVLSPIQFCTSDDGKLTLCRNMLSKNFKSLRSVVYCIRMVTHLLPSLRPFGNIRVYTSPCKATSHVDTDIPSIWFGKTNQDKQSAHFNISTFLAPSAFLTATLISTVK